MKDNQASLRQALEDAFADVPQAGAFEQTERRHGRRIAWCAEVIDNIGQVDAEPWPGGWT